MERVKDLKKLKIASNMVVAVLRTGKSKIILTDQKLGTGKSYSEIVLKGDDVSRFEIGDIIVMADLNNRNSMPFEYRGDQYLLLPSHAITVAISPDNFDPDAKNKPKKTK